MEDTNYVMIVGYGTVRTSGFLLSENGLSVDPLKAGCGRPRTLYGWLVSLRFHGKRKSYRESRSRAIEKHEGRVPHPLSISGIDATRQLGVFR